MLDLDIKPRRRDMSRQIETQIRNKIATGVLHPGDILPPVKKIAAQYGINHQTILKAYSKLKNENLLESFKGGDTRITGIKKINEILVVFDISTFSTQLSPGYQKFFKRISEHPIIKNIKIQNRRSTCDARLTPLLSMSDSGDNFFNSPLLARIDNDKEGDIIGILLIGYAASERMQSYLKKKKIPYAGVGSTRQYPCQTQMPFLELINTGVGYATEMGFRNIAFIYPKPDGIDFFKPAFKATVKTSGLTTKSEWIIPISDFSPASSRKLVHKILASKKRPDKLLILSVDDVVTIEALEELKSLKLSVPEDVGLFSFWTKDSDIHPFYKFPKMIVDASELFDGAVQLLLDNIQGNKKEFCTITVSTELQF